MGNWQRSTLSLLFDEFSVVYFALHVSVAQFAPSCSSYKPEGPPRMSWLLDPETDSSFLYRQ
jgi:hypothetical protein